MRAVARLSSMRFSSVAKWAEVVLLAVLELLLLLLVLLVVGE